ncbi:hypothetical protein Clacol_003902 [Clathrus columnatus]|uniref:Uncharacterized protein n=1 Tax=Clathrus columnatus TaxID=1419009 RepID=A0AAV5A885_9AGAM|nr:hypothetical protein Clacol_003902 [Clathrus columnatus]
MAAAYLFSQREVENPSTPCLSCTKQWCLDQKLDICVNASLGDINPDTATGKEGDVEARCFQRDSPRDQLVVTLFLLTVFGLLVGAGIKSRMEKAGIRVDANAAWDAARVSRRWWESFLPTNQVEFNLSTLSWGSRERRVDSEYQELEMEAERAKAVKSSVLIFLALIALSPVLRTLTAATSSDSIWALSACLFGINIILADYGPSEPRVKRQGRLTSVLSINAAISASVVLASRLSTNIAVFSLMLLSVQSFALFPLLRIQMQASR